MNREETAFHIAKMYKEEVKQHDDTCTQKGRGTKNISKLLKNGITPENLAESIENYIQFCEATKREEQYRKSCGNFFGRDATYESYLPQNYTPASVAKFGRSTNESGRVFGQGQVIS